MQMRSRMRPGYNQLKSMVYTSQKNRRQFAAEVILQQMQIAEF